jgi:hypothetical protein
MELPRFQVISREPQDVKFSNFNAPIRQICAEAEVLSSVEARAIVKAVSDFAHSLRAIATNV